MKHVLVTGGNGFIGRYVVEELTKRGYDPQVFDHRSPGASAEGVRSYFGDIRDSTAVDEAVGHADAVIHLAGVLGTQETIADPRPAAETNVLGGLNAITACAKYDVPLVNIAVGNWWMSNTYSITKNSVERFIEMKKEFEGKVMTSVWLPALKDRFSARVRVPPTYTSML
jgi:UDP-glucose 4-epimerase